MKKIAMLVPVCSRNQSYIDLDDTPIKKIFMPAFEKTKDVDENLEYSIFLGIDDNDEFYLKYIEEFKSQGFFPVIVKDCNHKPAMVWNALLKVAYDMGFDYFFQIGDDVELLTNGWCKIFIQKLQDNSNIGVVGPMDDENYKWRIENNKYIIIENSFVHRTHFDIFRYMFHSEIENYYCDDWITLVYDNYATIYMNIKCNNNIRHTRYYGKMVPKLYEYILEGRAKLLHHLSSSTSKTSTASGSII